MQRAAVRPRETENVGQRVPSASNLRRANVSWRGTPHTTRRVLDVGVLPTCAMTANDQRREPATRSADNATRRAGWRPFDTKSGSTLLGSPQRGPRCSSLPMRHVISLFSTGWQDGQDVFGLPRGTWSSCHPVILSDFSCDTPVLVSGFWVVERRCSVTPRESWPEWNRGAIGAFTGAAGLDPLSVNKAITTRAPRSVPNGQ